MIQAEDKKAESFVAFILSGNRARGVKTYGTLRRSGYTGPVRVVVADNDPEIEAYGEEFGDELVTFNRGEWIEKTQCMDGGGTDKVIVFARNACFKIAERLGYKNFVQLDDDYQLFECRFDSRLSYRAKKTKRLDHIFASLVEFLNNTPAKTIAMAQGGDFIGGKHNSMAGSVQLRRKAMNSFLCSVDKPFKFVGRINEDANTYCLLGSRGDLFFTTTQVSLVQQDTQQNSGGMTDAYLNSGTYLKSFYSVVCCPSFVAVRAMGTSNRRLHHNIRWRNAVPKIIKG